MKLTAILKICIFTATISFCLVSPPAIRAATANVSVTSSLTFVPATTDIFVNDTVLWTWAAGSDDHNVTSESSPTAWTWPFSPEENAPFSYSVTFTKTGTFPYECTIHAAENMKGSVVVAAAPSVPPTVFITSPTNGTVYAAPARLNLQAMTADADATVTNVQFLIGSTVVSNVPAAPFATTTNNLVAGTYTLAVVATDTMGLKGTNSTSTNAVVITVVTPVPLTLSSLQKTSGTFQFSYAANTGLSYVVQTTSNLTAAAWVPISTNQAAGSPVVFVDSHPTNNPGFYRVGLMPNP